MEHVNIDPRYTLCYCLLASVQQLIGLPVAAEEPVCAEIRTVEVQGKVVVVVVRWGCWGRRCKVSDRT